MNTIEKLMKLRERMSDDYHSLDEDNKTYLRSQAEAGLKALARELPSVDDILAANMRELPSNLQIHADISTVYEQLKEIGNE